MTAHLIHRGQTHPTTSVYPHGEIDALLELPIELQSKLWSWLSLCAIAQTQDCEGVPRFAALVFVSFLMLVYGVSVRSICTPLQYVNTFVQDVRTGLIFVNVRQVEDKEE